MRGFESSQVHIYAMDVPSRELIPSIEEPHTLGAAMLENQLPSLYLTITGGNEVQQSPMTIM